MPVQCCKKCLDEFYIKAQDIPSGPTISFEHTWQIGLHANIEYLQKMGQDVLELISLYLNSYKNVPINYENIF
jgi:hypothetical protein